MVVDQLSLTFSALADPTRRAILARLTAGQISVTELAAPHAMSLPAISKHLRVLERSGLITRSRQAQVRPCQLKAEPMKAAVDWLEHYRQHWEERLDRLDIYLKELQRQPTPAKAKIHGRRKNPSAESIAARTIGTTRVMAASPEKLFAAFRDPQRLTQWWGPNGFTSTFQEFDLRPGDAGAWCSTAPTVPIIPTTRNTLRSPRRRAL